MIQSYLNDSLRLQYRLPTDDMINRLSIDYTYGKHIDEWAYSAVVTRPVSLLIFHLNKL